MKFIIKLITGFTLLSCLAVAQNEGNLFFTEGIVHEIHFNFSQANYWDSLVANEPSETYMTCNVTIDGINYTNSGVRFKGNSSYNNPSQKKPFKIDLEEYVDGQTHDGLKQLSLNNAFKDPSFLREKLALDFMRKHQIHAPRATFARLYLNGTYWGLYSVIEDVGKTFLSQHYGNNDGNLFKGDPQGRLTWMGSDPASYYNSYELKTNEDLNDWSDLIALIDALNNSSDLDLIDALGSRLNFDAWYDYWVVHHLFVNLDSYIGSAHNYYIYHNEFSDKFEFIAWDENESFGNFTMGLTTTQLLNLSHTYIPQPANQRPLMKRILENETLKQAYINRYCELLAHFTPEAFESRIDSLANLIRPYVYEDNLKTYSNNQFEQNLTQDINVQGPQGGTTIMGLTSFIASRRSFLVQELSNAGCTSSISNEQLYSGRLFPNPASDYFFIDQLNRSVQTIEIVGVDGRIYQQHQTTDVNPVQKIDINLPSGIYLVKLISNDGQMNHLKLMVAP